MVQTVQTPVAEIYINCLLLGLVFLNWLPPYQRRAVSVSPINRLLKASLASRSPLTLGILTALTQPTPEALRDAIRETRRLTSKPFGVNITLLPSITPPDYPGFAKAAVEEGIRIIETAGSNPGPLIKYFKENGCIVIHKCTTIRHAKVRYTSSCLLPDLMFTLDSECRTTRR